jgi:hypothetical protein
MKKRMNAGGLAGLEQVNLSARARRHVEHQISFAAMIVELVIGKAPAKSPSNDARVSC